MRFYCTMVSAMAMAIAFTLSDATPDDLNGWYHCSTYTFSNETSSNSKGAECAIYKAPLCYPGICETPKNANTKSVDIFVKRIVATSGDPTAATNVWLLEGGPGYASADMEYYMVKLQQKLKGAVNVYTMDHRGTGRSSRLDCANNSLDDATAIAPCAQELQFQYGNLSSFSTTTAATDLATFISKFTNKKKTVVYGVSYGTLLVERLIHLAPPEVIGYVLDSVAPSGNVCLVSRADIYFGEVGDAFLELCGKDAACTAHFQSKTLKDTVQDLFGRLDKESNSPCGEIMKEMSDNDLPSSALRLILGQLVKTTYLRSIIPPIIYRLDRCAPKDVTVLKHFKDYLGEYLMSAYKDDPYQSTLLGYLIEFSEMWEIPTPSMAEMNARHLATRFSDFPVNTLNPIYCAFSKEKSKSCEEVGVSNYSWNPIIYSRDQYWNKNPTIPKHASVLLLNGKLDPQTPHKCAEFLLKSLNGDNKELITFDYAAHGIVASTFMVPYNFSSETCGMQLFASYVQNGGDLARVDKSCMKTMPGFDLTIPRSNLSKMLGTDEAYDGEPIAV